MKTADIGDQDLDTLPREIEENVELVNLYCKGNRLTELPLFPKLVILICRSNRLTWLPLFPEISILRCKGNLITELPEFPELTMLFCSNNPLEYIPYYPKLVKINLTGCPVAELMEDPTDVREYHRLWKAHTENRKKSARSC